MTNLATLEKWDRRYLALAQHIGQWSKDRSAKTGCVIADDNRIVRSTGYNGFVRGVDDNDEIRHTRPAKYDWSEHAERNAVFNAARIGVSVEHCTAYVNWFPCKDCARAVVQAGLIRLVGLEPNDDDPMWGEHFAFAKALFEETGVAVTLYSIPELNARC